MGGGWVELKTPKLGRAAICKQLSLKNKVPLLLFIQQTFAQAALFATVDKDKGDFVAFLSQVWLQQTDKFEENNDLENSEDIFYCINLPTKHHNVQ